SAAIPTSTRRSCSPGTRWRGSSDRRTGSSTVRHERSASSGTCADAASPRRSTSRGPSRAVSARSPQALTSASDTHAARVRLVTQVNALLHRTNIARPSGPVPPVRRNLALLRALGIEAAPQDEAPAPLPLTREDREAADRALAAAGASGGPYVFLYPGSSA